MSRHVEGSRVVAVRNADQDTIYLYGHGTYLGRRPRPAGEFAPDSPQHPDLPDSPTWREVFTEMGAAQIAQGRIEYVRDGVGTGLDQYGYPLDEDWPLERRVAANLTYLGENHCIAVEDADGNPAGHVYGHQCWWQSLDTYETRFGQGRTEVYVPVPDSQTGPAPQSPAPSVPSPQSPRPVPSSRQEPA